MNPRSAKFEAGRITAFFLAVALAGLLVICFLFGGGCGFGDSAHHATPFGQVTPGTKGMETAYASPDVWTPVAPVAEVQSTGGLPATPAQIAQLTSCIGPDAMASITNRSRSNIFYKIRADCPLQPWSGNLLVIVTNSEAILPSVLEVNTNGYWFSAGLQYDDAHRTQTVNIATYGREAMFRTRLQ